MSASMSSVAVAAAWHLLNFAPFHPPRWRKTENPIFNVNSGFLSTAEAEFFLVAKAIVADWDMEVTEWIR